jgi:hypothetical protein
VVFYIKIIPKLGFPFACHFIMNNDCYSAFTDEKEVLYNDGTNFDVIDVKD